jgi:hypothetical protein
MHRAVKLIDAAKVIGPNIARTASLASTIYGEPAMAIEQSMLRMELRAGRYMKLKLAPATCTLLS